MRVVGKENFIAPRGHPDPKPDTGLFRIRERGTRFRNELDELGTSERIDVVTLGTGDLKSLEAFALHVARRIGQPFEHGTRIAFRIDLRKVARAVDEANRTFGRCFANERDGGISVHIVFKSIDPVHPHKRFEVAGRSHATAELSPVGVLQPPIGAHEGEAPFRAQDVEPALEKAHVEVAPARHGLKCRAVERALLAIDLGRANVRRVADNEIALGHCVQQKVGATEPSVGDLMCLGFGATSFDERSSDLNLASSERLRIDVKTEH